MSFTIDSTSRTHHCCSNTKIDHLYYYDFDGYDRFKELTNQKLIYLKGYKLS